MLCVTQGASGGSVSGGTDTTQGGAVGVGAGGSGSAQGGTVRVGAGGGGSAQGGTVRVGAGGGGSAQGGTVSVGYGVNVRDIYMCIAVVMWGVSNYSFFGMTYLFFMSQILLVAS